MVKGEFDGLQLSTTGYHLAKKDGKFFHVDNQGNAVNAYVDCTDFVDSGYAIVVKEDGMAYLLDSELKEIPTGLKAEGGYAIDGGLVVVNGNEMTYLVFE